MIQLLFILGLLLVFALGYFLGHINNGGEN